MTSNKDQAAASGSLRKSAEKEYPDFPWLTPHDPLPVQELMRVEGWLEKDESVLGVSKAGEGNMNLTLRVQTSLRSVILKQARPWVEKYDFIEAPWDRVVFEQRFYERVQAIPEVAAQMPALLGASEPAKCLLLEDLGEASDLSSIYAGGAMAQGELLQLARYLKALHEGTRGEPDPDFANRDMRALNHQHLCEVPLQKDNGVELDEFELWLTQEAGRLRDDEEYTRAVKETGRRYLGDGPCLLHGDFFPGSWLRTGGGIRVIDPEFCYYGEPEWDLGVCLAHLRMGKQSYDHARDFLREYAGGERQFGFDLRWVARYAALEIMRRVIGVAQLPIPISMGFRAELLELSRSAMLHMSVQDLWR